MPSAAASKFAAFRCTSSTPRAARAPTRSSVSASKNRATIARADLALIVTDARESDQDADVAIVGRLPQSLRRIVVRNKIDLAGIEAKSSAPGGAEEVWLSAKTGAGVELLREAMLAAAGAHEDMEGTFLARERHLQAMRAAGTTSTRRRASTPRRPRTFAEAPRRGSRWRSPAKSAPTICSCDLQPVLHR
jgi:tRNA modification GTPase